MESEQIESQEKKVRQMRMLPLEVSRSSKQSTEKKLEGFDPLFRAWVFSRIQNQSMRISNEHLFWKDQLEWVNLWFQVNCFWKKYGDISGNEEIQKRSSGL